MLTMNSIAKPNTSRKTDGNGYEGDATQPEKFNSIYLQLIVLPRLFGRGECERHIIFNQVEIETTNWPIS